MCKKTKKTKKTTAPPPEKQPENALHFALKKQKKEVVIGGNVSVRFNMPS